MKTLNREESKIIRAKGIEPFAAQEYINLYKNKVSLLLIEDSFNNEEVFNLIESINYLKRIGFKFIIIFDTINTRHESFNTYGDLDSLEIGEQTEIYNAITNKVSEKVRLILDEVDLRYEIINSLDGEGNFFNITNLNIQKINKALKKGSVPVLYPNLLIKKQNIQYYEPLKFSSELIKSINLEKCIIVSKNNFKGISKCSSEGMLSLLSNLSDYKLNRLLTFLLNFIKLNPGNNRGHLISFSKDSILKEILTVDGEGIMITDNTKNIIGEEQYNEPLVKRDLKS